MENESSIRWQLNITLKVLGALWLILLALIGYIHQDKSRAIAELQRQVGLHESELNRRQGIVERFNRLEADFIAFRNSQIERALDR